MTMLQRFTSRLLMLVGVLAIAASADISFAEAVRIPDAAREWTHRDGRVKQLRFVRQVGEVVLFQDVARTQSYRVRFDHLSDADQAHINAMANDGSRIWTKNDGRSRRLKLIECDGEMALFHIPNVGLGLARVSDFCEVDQRLLQIVAKSEAPVNDGGVTFVAAIQPNDAAPQADAKPGVVAEPAAKPADAQSQPAAAAVVITVEKVQEALEAAFKNDDLKMTLGEIGANATISVAKLDSGFDAIVKFDALTMDAESAQKALDNLVAKALPQVTQLLHLREMETAGFILKLTLFKDTKEPIEPSVTPPESHGKAIVSCGGCCCECAPVCRPCRRFRLLGILRGLRFRRCCFE